MLLFGFGCSFDKSFTHAGGFQHPAVAFLHQIFFIRQQNFGNFQNIVQKQSFARRNYQSNGGSAT